MVDNLLRMSSPDAPRTFPLALVDAPFLQGTSHAMLQSGLARLKQLNDSLKTTRLPATKSAEADASTGTTAFA